MRNVAIILMISLLFGCDMSSFFPDANETFGRQNFNSAIALIELHKVRNGSYPGSLQELEHLGEWDMLWLSAVKYQKTDFGYNLFVTRGHTGVPELTYPAEFKNGLGLEESNVSWE